MNYKTKEKHHKN